MARSKRIVMAGHPHHVILRGNNRRRLFTFTPDYRLFLRLIGEALDRTGCKMHALCLMPNHVHVLMTPPDPRALSACTKHYAQKYAQRRNMCRASTGKLFEQSYISIPVMDEEQMAVTTVYIEVNAWRAGIVHDPARYRWSSFAINVGCPYRSAIPLRLITQSPWYLDLGDDPARRAREYLQLAGTLYLRGAVPLEVPADIVSVERASIVPYDRSLIRPDGTRAA